tara:strand:- start:636 stop:1907 length:1272 start_codon:yes stop_codon:yes gene_type:complete
MKKLINSLFKLKKIKSHKDIEFEKILSKTDVGQIFEAFSRHSKNSEIRFVGGCVRKILNYEETDDIDLATNVIPEVTQLILEKNHINYFNTGLKHGTITALINKKHFEITSLRKDVETDGRHSKVEFTEDWLVDASRRDFSINAIYADSLGNLFDPFNGKEDLKNGVIKFIGDADKRIKEDYLRILRYIRFYTNYSETPHEENIKKAIKRNIAGINNVSRDRLISEVKKLFLSKKFPSLVHDNFSIEIIKLIFPEIKNFEILKNLNDETYDLLSKKDFIFLLSLLIVDGTDNADYFLYKYNISNEDKKKILFLSNNYGNIRNKSFFNEKNLNKLHYNFPELLIDLIDFNIFISKKVSKTMMDLKGLFQSKTPPIFPITAKKLMDQFDMKEGRELGNKMKELENLWLNNNFKISSEEIESIIRN